jgi:hypothetical protein
VDEPDIGGQPAQAANLLFAAHALRDFGDSFVAIVLPAYLLALGFTPFAFGVPSCLTIATGLAFAASHANSRRYLRRNDPGPGAADT